MNGGQLSNLSEQEMHQPNPALQSFAKKEKKESSVKHFQEGQIERVKQEMDKQDQIIKRAEKELAEKERLGKIKEQKKLQKKIQKADSKERKEKQKFERLKSKHEAFEKRQFKRKVEKELREERQKKDGSKFLRKGLGFEDGVSRTGKRLTSRERLERQIRTKEKQLQKLRDKLMGL